MNDLLQDCQKSLMPPPAHAATGGTLVVEHRGCPTFSELGPHPVAPKTARGSSRISPSSKVHFPDFHAAFPRASFLLAR